MLSNRDMKLRPFFLPPMSERLYYRTHRLDDWPAVLAYSSSRSYWKYIPMDKPSESTAQKFVVDSINFEQKLFEAGICYAICERNTTRVIGNGRLDLVDRSSKEAHIGLGIDPSVWIRKYTDEAFTSLIEMGFEAGLERIVAMVDIDNSGSIKLVDRFAFTKEGVEKNRVCVRGVWRDHARYALCSSNWF